MYHPWEITLRELIERVRGEYGPAPAEMIEMLAFLREYDLDEILEPEVVRYFLLASKLKPEDFGLYPDD